MSKILIICAFVVVMLGTFLYVSPQILQLAAVGTASISDITFKQTTLDVEEGSVARVTVIAPSGLMQTTRVRVKVTGGTARSGIDFKVPATQAINFYKGGLREKSFSVSIKKDTTQESPETITLGLFSQTNEPLHKTLTITITDKGTIPTPSVSPQVNLNAIPTNTALDANGWPRYLKVPATCAKPAANKKYIFEPRLGRHPTDNFSNAFIAPLLLNGFGGSSGEFVLNKTDEEIMVLPYYAPYLGSVAETGKTKQAIALLGNGAAGNATLYWAPHAAYGNQMQVSISKCPGGENPLVTTAASGSGTLIAKISALAESAQTTNGTVGNLTQGEYYFIHIEGTCERDFSGSTYTTGVYARNGKPLCASILQSYGSYDGTTVPPYTGPELTKGPYPINYNYKTILAAKGYKGNEAMRWRCFDAKGKGEEVRYEATSRGWTEPNKPAYTNYVCAAAGSTESVQRSFEDVPVYRVCAKHSVGYTRTSRVSLFNVPLEHTDTCQFDTTKSVYLWKTTSSSNSTIGLLDQNTQTGAYNFTQAWNSTPGTVEYKNANGTIIKSERFH